MSLFRSEMKFLKLGQLSLLQSTMELSQIETVQFKCDEQLLHILNYKVMQQLFSIRFITNCNRYNKVQWIYYKLRQ